MRITKVFPDTKLDLSAKGVSDKKLVGMEQYLKEHKNIVELDLSWNNISAEGAKILSKISTIKILNLSSTLIGNEGAEVLAKNKNIETLFLSGCGIGKSGIIALATNTTISNLVFL